MKKRVLSLVIFGLLLLFIILAATRQHQDVYPMVEVEVTDPSQHFAISFLLNSRPTLRECEALTGNIAREVLKQCPQCRIKHIQCENTLDEARQTLFTDTPLTIASGRMVNGIILFHTANPEIALAACQAAETQSAKGGNPVKCYAANTPRTKLPAQSVFSPWSIAIMLAAFVSAWLVGWLIIKYEHLHAHLSHDHIGIGPQKYHTEPTPRIGGLAVMSGLLSAGSVMLFAEISPIEREFGLLLAACIPAFFGGLVEDITKKVGVLERLLLTMLSGAAAAWLLGAVLARLSIPGFDQAMLWLPFAVIFTSFAVGGIANSINIIDGYNGLAGGFAVIVLVALAYVAYLVGNSLVFTAALALTGALLGFLIWNWPGGHIFLGDGGAYLLGFMLAELSVLLVARNPEVSPWLPLLLLIYPVFETFFSIYRRKVKNGLSPGQPDNMHLHQLIHDNVVQRGVCLGTDLDKLNANSCVAKYLWMPAIVTAVLGALYWQSTMALAGITFTYCILYVVSYRQIAQKNITPAGSEKRRAA